MQKLADQNTWKTLPDLQLNFDFFKAEIVTHMMDVENKKKFAYYIIECSYTKQIKWEIKRRYSQFENLAKVLALSFLHIPPLPGKTLFSVTQDSQLDKRKAALNDFLKGLIVRREMFSNHEFNSFLGIPKYVPFLMSNFPVPVGRISNVKNRAYREAFFCFEEDFAVVGGHQVFVANRLDSYFSNFFKKSDKNRAEVFSQDMKSVGLVEFLRRVDKGNEAKLAKMHSDTKEDDQPVKQDQMDGDLVPINQDSQIQNISGEIAEKEQEMIKEMQEEGYFNYQKVFDKAFKYQVISMAWSKQTSMIVVGLDSGDIYLLGYDVADNRNFTSERCLEQVHTKRVMRLHVDEKRRLLFSVGEDKKFACIDLEDKTVVSRLTIPGNKLTHMIVHSPYKMAFIADVDGAIFVIDVSKKYPDLLQKINTLMKGPIRSLIKVPGKDILIASSGQDGLIKAFYNPTMKDGKSSYTCILQIRGPLNARCMAYWPSRKELWVGYARGVVSVYSNVDFDCPVPDSEVVSARESVTCNF